MDSYVYMYSASKLYTFVWSVSCIRMDSRFIWKGVVRPNSLCFLFKEDVGERDGEGHFLSSGRHGITHFNIATSVLMSSYDLILSFRFVKGPNVSFDEVK